MSSLKQRKLKKEEIYVNTKYLHKSAKICDNGEFEFEQDSAVLRDCKGHHTQESLLVRQICKV